MRVVLPKTNEACLHLLQVALALEEGVYSSDILALSLVARLANRDYPGGRVITLLVTCYFSPSVTHSLGALSLCAQE